MFSSGKSVEIIIEEGRKHQTAGNLNKAYDCFVDALKREPENTEAIFHIGVIQMMGGRFDTALSFFDKLIELQPEAERNWNNRAICLQKLGDIDGALESFDQALAINPNYFNAWLGKGDALYSIASNSELIPGPDGKPVIKQKTAEFTNALKCYEEALKLNDNFPPALLGKAFCLYFLKRRPEAREIAWILLRVDPNNESAHALMNLAMFD